MNYRIKVLPNFVKDIKRLSKKYPSIKQDYADLLDELQQNPYSGIDLGNGRNEIEAIMGIEL